MPCAPIYPTMQPSRYPLAPHYLQPICGFQKSHRVSCCCISAAGSARDRTRFFLVFYLREGVENLDGGVGVIGGVEQLAVG